MRAAWKIDGLYKADACKVAEELESLGDTYSLSDVVDMARNENSEMHDCFEWDDSIAGNKYREIQAAKIIRLLVITKEDDDKKEEKTNIRFFVSTGNNDNTYTPTRLIVRNQTAYEELLERAYAELRAFKAKYSNLKELDEILALID